MTFFLIRQGVSFACTVEGSCKCDWTFYGFYSGLTWKVSMAHCASLDTLKILYWSICELFGCSFNLRITKKANARLLRHNRTFLPDPSDKNNFAFWTSCWDESTRKSKRFELGSNQSAKYVEIRTRFKISKITLKATLGLDATCWKRRELRLTAMVDNFFYPSQLSSKPQQVMYYNGASARGPGKIYQLQSYLVFINLCECIHYIDLREIWCRANDNVLHR